MTLIVQGFIDHSREHSRTQFYVEPGVGDDQTTPIADAGIVATALAVISLCNFTTRHLSLEIDTVAPVAPASSFAQRESAMWVQYVDDVTDEYGSLTIPGPDLALVSQAGTDEMDIVANITVAALVLALETSARSREGNAITVTRARFRGRRT